MKNPILSLLLLSSLAACQKDKDPVDPPPGPDPNENATATTSIVAYNATQWTVAQPYGTLSEGAKVTLFKSPADYPANPAATATTNAEGKATFVSLAPGEYYVVAEQDYLHEKISNLLYYTAGSGGFSSDSLWQAAPGAQDLPVPMFGAAGNFRFKDVNADGRIDQNDRETFPAKKITAEAGKSVVEKVLMGQVDNRPFTKLANATAINAALALAYIKMAAWHEQQATLDAVFTDEADCTNVPRWCPANTYQLTAADAGISKVWTEGFGLITTMGNIMAQAEKATDLNDAEKKSIIGQARALKAYLYLELTTYFGPLPVQEWLVLGPTTARATQDATYQYIESLLTTARSELQAAGLTTNRSKISAAACQALLAKLYLQQRSFQKALDAASAVITGYNFSLGTGNAVFTQTNSAEAIWSSSDQAGIEVKFNFKKGTILPEIRLAELLLIKAEASIELGQLADGRDLIHQLRQRAGNSTLTQANQPELGNELREEWKREMSFEGMRFSSLSRWNLALQTLGPLGFKPNNSYLPIPLTPLIWYVNIIQNPGY